MIEWRKHIIRRFVALAKEPFCIKFFFGPYKAELSFQDSAGTDDFKIIDNIYDLLVLHKNAELWFETECYSQLSVYLNAFESFFAQFESRQFCKCIQLFDDFLHFDIEAKKFLVLVATNSDQKTRRWVSHCSFCGAILPSLNEKIEITDRFCQITDHILP